MELVTDTAGRIGNTRLNCPECNGNHQITMQHIIEECTSIREEREDVLLYYKANEPMSEKLISKNPNMLPMLMEAASGKINPLIHICFTLDFQH